MEKVNDLLIQLVSPLCGCMPTTMLTGTPTYILFNVYTQYASISNAFLPARVSNQLTTFKCTKASTLELRHVIVLAPAPSHVISLVSLLAW